MAKLDSRTKKFDTYSFPKDFLWGASTSGHQVEGGNFDQWTVFELDNASMLAKTAASRLRWLPDWMKFKDEAEDPDNYVSGKGVDHWRRYKEDFRILKKLNLNSFRFGIEWSRVEPEQGVWDKAAIDHYHNYIAELKRQGIEPIMNLWHWTHPVWFDALGGFSKRKNVAHFERFVQKIAEEFGQDIKYIITLNEPNIYVSYPEWNFGLPVPPHQNKLVRLLSFFWLVRAHKRAYAILKSHNPHIQVSAAVQMAHNVPKNQAWISRLTVKLADLIGNYLFYDLCKRQLDFIGFNYYFTNYLTGKALFNGFKPESPANPHNDVGWYMEPVGVGEVATKLWMRYRKPILIAENGVADSEDQYRKWWLEETMHAMMLARKAGVNLIGYMHWSLLDNFEWAFGWWPRFGLIKVDRERDMKRLVRPSAIWWAKTLKSIRHDG